MSRVELAVSCYNGGFVCSQAILSTYGPLYGLERENALKIADAFGGGMARMGETCGAVTGAFMVMGLKYGRTVIENSQTHEDLYGLVREFISRFISRNGSIMCRDLLHQDISTPQGLKEARDKNLFKTLCPEYVKNAVEILEEFLDIS